MKRLVGSILVLLLVVGFASNALAAVKVGSIVPVRVPDKSWYQFSRMDEPLPDWPEWVTVANPDGISNCNYRFKFGEDAYVAHNGTLKVIRLDGTRVLVEYATLEKGGGTSAPNGTLCFMAKSEFSRLMAKYEKEVRDARKRVEKEKESARKEELRLRPQRDHVRALLNTK